MKITTRNLMFLFVACVPVVVAAQQQTASGNKVASIAFVQDVSELSNQDLSDALLELKERTRQLKLEIEGNGPQFSPASSTRGSTSRTIADAASSNDKLKEMEKTFDFLQKIIDEKRRRQIEAQRNSPPEEASSLGSSSKIKLPNVNKDGTIVEMGSGSRLTDQSSNQPPELTSVSTSVPTQVVSKIIDPFELGNSLFLQGSYSEAMDFYNLVPENQLPGFDQIWLHLMKATCHRAIGETDDAEAKYREVANAKQSSRPSEIAKGWLEYLNTKKTIDGLYSDYEKKADVAISKADELIEELDAYKN